VLDDAEVPEELVAVNEIEYAVPDDNPVIVYEDALPEPDAIEPLV
jgi:hypothetical protein